jgi:hypothetical protein
MSQSLSRRSIIRIGILSLIALSPLTTRFAQEAGAKKNTGKKPMSVAQRTRNFMGFCQELGGEAAVISVRPGGTTVSCNKSSGNQTCTVTSKAVRCYASAAQPDSGDLPDFQPVPTHHVPGDVPTAPLKQTGNALTNTAFDGKSRNRRKR